MVLATAPTSLQAAEFDNISQITHAEPLGLESHHSNRVSIPLLKLGSFLLDSGALAGKNPIRCTTCHDPLFGFSEGRRDFGKLPRNIGARKAPPIFNLVWSNYFMMDGRARSLSEQIPIPLRSEMHTNWPLACQSIKSDHAGQRLLQQAKLGPCSEDIIVQALAAYVGSLVSGNSRFDQFYYGGKPDALTDEEQRGFRVFVRSGRCSTCHLVDGLAAPFTDGSFHSVGVGFVRGAYSDHGRMGVSNQANDDGAFKTPTLRNAALRTCFMHDGSLASLRDVIDYYDRGGTPGARNQDPRIHRLFLSEEEKTDLIAFLKALNSPILEYIPEPEASVVNAKQ